ncbi:MAG: hypothetical protein H7124_08220 [Phycisphaerales bacterium]|nr:hypothetical protein [Hyphomonadaceae bacterium]
MLKHIKRYAPVAISLFAAAVFLDSLRYKFTDHPNTQEIFGRLDTWAASLGASGLFGHTGLFSQYVIGTAELFAATLLLVGLLPRFVRLNALGALIGLAVMTGAVSFHVFTPLGIDPNNDGGGLFAAALTIWISSIALLIIRRNEIAALLADLARAFIPSPKPAAAPMRAPAHA